MIHAYSEIYLDDAMNTLAEVFSYTPDARQADVLFQRFVMSGIAYQFGKGNPRYLNMPSQALFYEIVGDSMPLIYPRGMGRSPQYWCGYVLAYYQWYTGLGFEKIGWRLPPSRIIDMYHPLHEADIQKFVDELLTELAPKSVRSVFSILRLGLDEAYEKNFVTDVCRKTKLPKVKRKEVKVFTKQEQKK